jgi:hypothetical protein
VASDEEASMAGPSPIERLERELRGLPLLASAGAVYLFMGLVFGAAWLWGGVDTSLFPTGWLFPVVLLSTGVLMTLRRRSDVVLVVWFAFALAVYLLDMSVVTQVLLSGLSDAAAFDASIIAFLFALLPLLLRPQFRS